MLSARPVEAEIAPSRRIESRLPTLATPELRGTMSISVRPIEVLLVDGSDSDRRLIRRMLGEAKIANRLSSAADGFEALRILRDENANPIDLLLVSFNLPRMSGPDLLALMGDDPALVAIPVVLMVGPEGAGDTGVAEESRQVRAVVTKPLGLASWAAIVRAVEEFRFQIVHVITEETTS